MSSSHPVPADGDGDRALPPERQPRTNLFLSAQLSLPGEPPQPVRVRNLSASGARIDTPQPPPRGTALLLCRGAAEVSAEVMWSSEGSCGLRFTGTIDVARWMSDRPGAATATCLREPTLAEELGAARQMVERLEDVLSARPEVVAALGTELQALDLLSQLLASVERRSAGLTVQTGRALMGATATFLRQPPASGANS